MTSYYHSVLTRVLTLHPSLVADESLFQALLLALVAKRQGVIVRTPEKAKVLTQIVNILHLLLGLSVVKLRLRQSDRLSSDDFMRLLFLENPAHAQATSRTSSRRTLNAGGNHASAFRRSSSYPISSATDDTEFGLTELRNTLDKPSSEYGARSSLQSATLHEHQTLHRTQTDPTPASQDDKTGGVSSRLFPNVLVVSGLEYTSEEVQSALWNAMSEGRISIGRANQSSRVNQKNSFSEGVWQLPSDFFVVYVCPLGNGYDRPPVHRSLVDRFAMSIEAYPPTETSIDSRAPPVTPTDIKGAPLRSILSPLELADLRVLAGPTHTIVGNRADLYLSDLLSTVRNHPHLDGMLITARCRSETLRLLRAWRALFGAPPEHNAHALPTLDVTDEDVRRVFIIAVSHRISVLKGPREETLAGLVFSVVANHGEEEWETGRRTIKEILREIVDIV
ncbi:hypothetical protein ACEPAH_6715 [Sanghuangporus vaninii]